MTGRSAPDRRCAHAINRCRAGIPSTAPVSSASDPFPSPTWIAPGFHPPGVIISSTKANTAHHPAPRSRLAASAVQGRSRCWRADAAPPSACKPSSDHQHRGHGGEDALPTTACCRPARRVGRNADNAMAPPVPQYTAGQRDGATSLDSQRATDQEGFDAFATANTLTLMMGPLAGGVMATCPATRLPSILPAFAFWSPHEFDSPGVQPAEPAQDRPNTTISLRPAGHCRRGGSSCTIA